jgi:hypothetical protein
MLLMLRDGVSCSGFRAASLTSRRPLFCLGRWCLGRTPLSTLLKSFTCSSRGWRERRISTRTPIRIIGTPAYWPVVVNRPAVRAIPKTNRIVPAMARSRPFGRRDDGLPRVGVDLLERSAGGRIVAGGELPVLDHPPQKAMD